MEDEVPISNNLDKKKLTNCAKMIIGTHNFIIFCKALSIQENNNCIVKTSEWIFEKDMFFYKISANRFLHHMVRMLVGTMIEVAKNNMSISTFNKMVKANINKPRIINAPACGLYLNKVKY